MKTTISLSCLLALVICPTAPSDVVISGERNIRVECELEFGPYVDLAARKHVVAEGDTLGRIAARMLGRAERWPEISALNAGVDPENLKVGRALWVPAVESEHGHWWHLFAIAGGGHFGGDLARISHGERVPHHHYYTRVYAVRNDRLADFERAFGELEADGPVEPPVVGLIERWKNEPGFAAGAVDLPGRDSIFEGSASRRRVETWEITGIEGGTIGLRRVATQGLDENGEPVQRAPSMSGSNGTLLALSFLALAGLIAVGRRRKTADSGA